MVQLELTSVSDETHSMFLQKFSRTLMGPSKLPPARGRIAVSVIIGCRDVTFKFFQFKFFPTFKVVCELF